MKKLVYMFLTVFALAACQPDNNGGNTVTANNVATTPLQLNCLNGSTYCNNTMYNQYPGFVAYPGWYNYAYNYNNTFVTTGFCGCPTGYLPTYNTTYGLGCVQSQLLYPYWNDFFMWTYWGTGWGYYAFSAPQPGINQPHFSNIPTNTSGLNSCTQTLTQNCDLNVANSCGAGATCRQVIAGSSLGVCVR